MKVMSLSPVLSLLLFIASATANFSLAPFPSSVQLGNTYTLNWTATGNYSYTIWLIQENPNGNEYSWTKVSSLVTGLRFNTLAGAYTWTVPTNISASSKFGLWLDAFPIPFNGASYSNQTEWFAVSSSSSSSSSGSASATASSTASRATSTPSSATSSGTTSGASSGTHHTSLSGGAIAGIVIGCLVAIALAIGAFFFITWRKKKAAVEKRQAAARASRLAPVMQESSSAYEMHNRAPQANKETNV